MDRSRNAVPSSITARLLPGEKVVWWGWPAQGLMLRPRDALLIPFSLLWGGFAIFWETLALRGKAPFPFALFGVPFVLVGLFMIAGRFVVDAWLRRRLTYALTDRRILIVRSGSFPALKSLNLDGLSETDVSEQANGRGTIRFGPQAPMWGNRSSFGSWMPALDSTPQFLAIEDVQRVFATIQERARLGTR